MHLLGWTYRRALFCSRPALPLLTFPSSLTLFPPQTFPSSHFSLLAQLEAIKDELERKDLKYPDYYLKPFHSYDQGNLSWSVSV